MADEVDLTGARSYRETAAVPIVRAQWWVWEDGRVLLERDASPGVYEPAIIAADTLTTNPSWVATDA